MSFGVLSLTMMTSVFSKIADSRQGVFLSAETRVALPHPRTPAVPALSQGLALVLQRPLVTIERL